LRSGLPPVTAHVEVEGAPIFLFGPKEIKHVAAEVRHIGPDSMEFTCSNDFKPGSELRMRLGVPLLAAGQALNSEAIFTVQKRVESSLGVWLYTGSLVVPLRLTPILSKLHEQERRVAKRFRSSFRVLSHQLKSYQATAVDLSATGFGFVSATGFELGSVHDFSLDLDDDMQNTGGIKVKGLVVHCDPRPEGGYRMGVHFVDLTEAETRPMYHFLHTFK
jgi:hypothetical protein